ncbi:oxidoreductase, short chain dehydrogenase/reductase family protein [Pseudooceanicola batsensis HTCC2597]|uniref:Oxidoreductase, short chain dehydrogenase/reductase family protein n=1 Tax=Pseudooceanicola batsensis (strain ATCC BAA-863 / DSM 15984 / KCTC 12145 / HTCC2597) TaxID=252305 RepID=A3TV16_PSEBH|nr:SDR family oxidoreductase [Pseudooceanicola batsensis]EAQ04362.1 oxidoreductase, short chain dehydrogenase/reductase family protein [Pseudooceanicola batsensis HTCC2597]
MKSIFITGASGGIGRATADLFLDEGWTVGCMARRADVLEEAFGHRDKAHLLPGDVTDEATVDSAIAEFAGRVGRLDVLFNNAGTFGRADTIDGLSLTEWREVVDLNLTGMFLAARAAFRQMRSQVPQGGRIINNGSISAHVPRQGSIAYTATKHAVTGMTRSLSLDGRAFDIACGQIDIGNARTELLQGIIDANPDDPPPSMDVRHAAEAVLHMAALPAGANVQFMTVMATKMPYIGRG